MRNPRQFFIEGVDRMGKSTVIDGILNELGYYLVVHSSKPKRLRCYEAGPQPLFEYQHSAYHNLFDMVSSDVKVIFDRAHLGEMVYAPLYRGYDGSYVLEMEAAANTRNSRLVLLTTSDFSFVKDDGLSLDFSKKEEEQAVFVEAFNASTIKDKVLVDVSNGNGGYKTADQILCEVLKK